MNTTDMLRFLNQHQDRRLLDQFLIQPQPSNHFLNFIINERRTDERLFQQMLFNQLSSNPQMLIQLFNALSDAQRMAPIQTVLPRAAGARALSTAEIAQFIGASQQQAAPRSMPSSGLNAEKLADKDVEIPPEYCCSLSLSIMTDPVYILDDLTGARFERDWITKWLAEHGTHPTTRAAYLPSALRADTALKARIDEFVQSAEATTTSRPGK